METRTSGGEQFTKTPVPLSKSPATSPSIRNMTQTVIVSLDETVTHDITYAPNLLGKLRFWTISRIFGIQCFDCKNIILTLRRWNKLFLEPNEFNRTVYKSPVTLCKLRCVSVARTWEVCFLFGDPDGKL
ncbi:unnamed protein product [Phyllotreta striolata]|uniref:Uncharacterized protein n=1 Tax=Phyllotreta striolata TaxID=444603 RepID=A0A9N9TKT9_PHYSR|nr:unnamed protein product [Phyllotreta striolata]